MNSTSNIFYYLITINYNQFNRLIIHFLIRHNKIKMDMKKYLLSSLKIRKTIHEKPV